MGNNKNARARHHYKEVDRAEAAESKREERLRRRRERRARKRGEVPAEEQEQGE